MGQFNNMLVKGSSRFLGKIFCSDISISGNTVLTGSITATGRSSFTGGINVGYEHTSFKLSTASLIVNDWIRTNGASGWYSQTYGGGWYMFDDTYVRVVNAKRVLASNGIYTGASAAYYLDTNGKLNASNVVSGSGTINSLIVQTALNASSANGSFNNLSVNNTIKAVKYEISHVMNLGGNFICSPSFYFTEGTTTVTVNAKTGNVVQLLITDSTSIQSTDMAGATWYAGSKIRLSGIINGASLSSVDGTVTRTMNTVNAGTLLVDLDVGSLSSSFTVNNTYSGTNVSNLCVMMYEINMGISGTTKNRPIGIKMTSYGTNKASYVDVWSGASDTPNVRFGLLNNTGLPNVNGATPTGWGLYTTNGYFQGTVVSNAGKIGDFNISSALYSGSHSSYASSNAGVYIGADGISIGANFKVDNRGNLISSTLNSAINEVEIGGINRFIKKNTVEGSYLNATGAVVTNSDWGYTDYINVSSWSYYVCSGYTNLGNSPSTCFYNSSKEFVSAVAGSARSTVHIPADAAYMRFSFTITDLTTIKIEKGKKPTDYSPAPEDIENNISEISNKITETINKNTTTINQTVEDIKATVTKLEENNDGLTDKIESAIDLKYNEISLTITTTVDEKTNGLVTKDEISKWMTFTEEGELTLGNTESDFTVRISNEELGFYEGENRVAYISNSKLYIDQAILISRMDLGDFTIEYDESTGFSIS